MLSLSRSVRGAADAAAFLSDARLARELREASCVLVQVFWNGAEEESVAEVAEAVLRAAPGAVIVGACSSGFICEGQMSREGIGLSVACFRLSRLVPAFIEAAEGSEREVGRALGEELSRCSELKAALLLAPALNLDASSLGRAFGEALPTLPIFGGGATQDGDGSSGILFGAAVRPRGVAAIGLCGAELSVEIQSLFDWRPLGPAVVLSETGAGCIRRINGRPAFDLYREKLDIRDSEDVHLLEFPLLLERGGGYLACNPISVTPDGGVRISAEARSGESARLGVLDMASLEESVDAAAASLCAFGPEAIFLYSCVCRLFTLQEECSMEILPFQALAPAAGFFTSGEFSRLGSEVLLLNSSEVVVGLREGAPAPRRAACAEDGRQSPVPAIERHIRATSRLFRFIGSLTDSLGAEVVERRKAEERAKAAAAEKEELLRELQHRVKNSMAIISSIASLESMRAELPETKAALGSLESRVSALASLYDILFYTGSIEEIGLAGYLGRVVDSAAAGLGADARGISVGRELAPVGIDVKRAISLGLIVNELVTDCVKHAFPSGGGRIDVSLSLEGGELALSVEDDGVGLGPGFSESALSSLGLTLVRSLADGLGAKLSIRGEPSARFELRFPL